jgi:hypothetical protein
MDAESLFAMLAVITTFVVVIELTNTLKESFRGVAITVGTDEYEFLNVYVTVSLPSKLTTPLSKLKLSSAK